MFGNKFKMINAIFVKIFFLKLMQKILVTGGCGYIGSHTLVDLIENGF